LAWHSVIGPSRPQFSNHCPMPKARSVTVLQRSCVRKIAPPIDRGYVPRRVHDKGVGLFHGCSRAIGYHDLYGEGAGLFWKALNGGKAFVPRTFEHQSFGQFGSRAQGPGIGRLTAAGLNPRPIPLTHSPLGQLFSGDGKGSRNAIEFDVVD